MEAAQSTALHLRQELALFAEPAPDGAAPVSVPARPPRSAAGADPCGPVSSQPQRRSTAELRVAERFQPRLLLSREDDFWPVSPAAVEHALEVSVVGPRQRTARTAAASSRTPARIAGSGICP